MFFCFSTATLCVCLSLHVEVIVSIQHTLNRGQQKTWEIPFLRPLRLVHFRFIFQCLGIKIKTVICPAYSLIPELVSHRILLKHTTFIWELLELIPHLAMLHSLYGTKKLPFSEMQWKMFKILFETNQDA